MKKLKEEGKGISYQQEGMLEEIEDIECCDGLTNAKVVGHDKSSGGLSSSMDGETSAYTSAMRHPISSLDMILI